MPPRRSGRNVNAAISDVPTTEVSPVATKKGGKHIKNEDTEVLKLAANSTRTKAKEDSGNLEDADEGEEEKKAIDIPKTVKIVNMQKEAAVVTKNKAPVKRKLKEEEDEGEEDKEEKKTTKKRKTKEEKEAETMPLAERTLVSTLKKAVHIGAHVSGAGGKCKRLHGTEILSNIYRRRPKFSQ